MGRPTCRSRSELGEPTGSGRGVLAASQQDASHHLLLLLLSVCLPFPAGIFIFIWLVVLYYPKTKEAAGSLSHIIRHDKITTVSQD